MSDCAGGKLKTNMDSENQIKCQAQEAGRSSLHEVLAGLARQLEWLARVSEPAHKDKITMIDMHHAGANFAYRHAAALVDKAVESLGPANTEVTDAGPVTQDQPNATPGVRVN